MTSLGTRGKSIHSSPSSSSSSSSCSKHLVRFFKIFLNEQSIGSVLVRSLDVMYFLFVEHSRK